MKTLFLLIIGCVAQVGCVSAQQVLGKHPADTFAVGFFGQNNNANKAVAGINTATTRLSGTVMPAGLVQNGQSGVTFVDPVIEGIIPMTNLPPGLIANGQSSVNFGQLTDAYDLASVNPNNRMLADDNTSTTLDWQNHLLINSSHAAVLDWQNRRLLGTWALTNPGNAFAGTFNGTHAGNAAQTTNAPFSGLNFDSLVVGAINTNAPAGELIFTNGGVVYSISVKPYVSVGGGGGGSGNGSVVGGTPMIDSQAIGTLRTNGGQLGLKFWVNTTITVNSLGRWVVAGNTHTHDVSILDGEGTTVLGSATVNTGGATPGAYRYMDLATPLVLPGGAFYLIVTTEGNGDQYADSDTAITTTGVANSYAASFIDFGVGGAAGAGFSFGPVNLLYQ